jgi:hypothetical protein
MSGPINIQSSSEWQGILSSTNVVIADCMSPPSPRLESSDVATDPLSP